MVLAHGIMRFLISLCLNTLTVPGNRFDLVDTQGMTEEQLRDIAYTKVE